MSVLLVRLRPGIDRSALNFLPVAVRERPGSYPQSPQVTLLSGMGHSIHPAPTAGPNDLAGFRQPFLASAQSRSKNGFGSRDQLETSFPSCASRVCSCSPGSDRRGLDCVPVAVRERLGGFSQSLQVSVRSASGLSIRRHPGLATVPPSPPRGCLGSFSACGGWSPPGQAQRVSPMTRHPMSPGQHQPQTLCAACRAASITSPAPADLAGQLGPANEETAPAWLPHAERGRQLKGDAHDPGPGRAAQPA